MNLRLKASVSAILLMVVVQPAHAGTIQTCSSWGDCFILKFVCKKHNGVYGGAINMNDWSVTGTCVV